MKILVVGAGISGLAASWKLRNHDVRVLEATAEIGGRMRSELVGGHLMEIGAQFLSSHYEVVPLLAEAMGLTPTAISAGTGVVQNGTVRRFRSDRPLSQFTGRVLPFRAGPKAALGLLRVRRTSRNRPTSELSEWADHDDESGSEWGVRVLGPRVADRVLAPTINGLYFQSLHENSAALPAAVSAFGARPGSALTLPGGLGQLTQRLSENVDVRLETRVTDVRRDGRQVRVTTTAGMELVDRVIVAVPASAAQQILPDATSAERRLMSTPYSRGLLVGIPLEEALGTSQLGSAYGVVVHPNEVSPIAAVAVASRASTRGSGEGDLLTVMLNDATAAEMRLADDSAVYDVAVKALLDIDTSLRPLLPVDPALAKVVRHSEAMPTCPPGHAARVRDYRHGPNPGPVILAGDYLGFPWTDSAAATGIWAAGTALR